MGDYEWCPLCSYPMGRGACGQCTDWMTEDQWHDAVEAHEDGATTIEIIGKKDGGA